MLRRILSRIRPTVTPRDPLPERTRFVLDPRALDDPDRRSPRPGRRLVFFGSRGLVVTRPD